MVALALGGPAAAYPFATPRPAPDAIAGVTDQHPASMVVNPATIGGMRGVRLFLDGGARLHLGSIGRDAVDGRAQPDTSITWANLDSLLGFTWDLGTESFAIGLAAHTPFTELSSYPGSSPVRYHERWQRFATLEEMAVASWQIIRQLAVGAAFLVNESWIDYGFSRDAALGGGSALVSRPNALCGGAACGFENPEAEQQLRLRGFGVGFGFSVGVVVHPTERLWLGASYSSHAGTGGLVSLFENRRAHVRPAPGQSALDPRVRCDDVRSDDPGSCNGSSRVIFLLPEEVNAGLRFQLSSRLELEGSFRFIHYGARDRLDIAVQGGTIASRGLDRLPAGVPPEQRVDRGLQNVYSVEGSVRLRLGDRVTLMPSLLVQTSAIAPDAVNAAALDAPKIDATLVMEYTAWRSRDTRHSVTIGAHLGGTGYVLGRVDSRFRPDAEVACVDARYRLESCGASLAGDGLPSAAGRYTLFVVHLGGAIGFQY